ncbi:hypothetical protein FQR65_LT02326 [Abscondita terminalis]|nr:hypothetical protein FQR65_LT02326 [Abscondita terminalis]
MSDQEIESVVLTAQSKAIDICNKMGIKECITFAMNILPVDLDSLNCIESLDCMSDDKKLNDCNINKCDVGTILNDYDLSETDLETDCQLEESISFSETLNLKDYSHDNKGKDIDFVNGPFLKVLLENGSAKTVKKTSLCWLFSKNSAKLSSDKLTRFTSKQVSNEKLKLKPVKTFKTPRQKKQNAPKDKTKSSVKGRGNPRKTEEIQEDLRKSEKIRGYPRRFKDIQGAPRRFEEI